MKTTPIADAHLQELAEIFAEIQDRARTIACNRALDLEFGFEVVTGIETDLRRLRRLELHVERTIGLERDGDDDLGVRRADVRDLAGVRSRLHELAEVADASQVRMRALLPSAVRRTPVWEQSRESRVVVAPVAGRLAAVTTRLLPAGDRARYSEEFRGELFELAESGAGRWGQLAYALRLIARARTLRIELKAPSSRKASS